MIAIIRIKGMIGIRKDTAETLHRLKLRRKYACSLVDETNKEIMGMVKKVKDFIAFGPIDDPTLTALLKARMQPIDKKQVRDAGTIAKEILAGKSMKELGLKPFFRLHPARGGIDTKNPYPKGVLGNNKKDINKLIMKML